MSKMKEIMPFFSLVFCVILSAASLSLGIPNELILSGSALLGLFSLTPFYYALLHARSFKTAGVLCGAHIALTHLFSSFWLAYFKDFAVFTLGASTAAYFALGIPIGWWLWTALHSRAEVRPFVFSACWVCWEWLKSTGFLAYPWGTLPMTSRSLFLFIQIADTTGVWGISFLFATVSAFTAEFLSNEPSWRRPLRAENGAAKRCGTHMPGAVFTAALFGISCVYGAHTLSRLPPSETSFTAAIIQQNSDPWGDDGDTLKRLQDLTRAAVADAENATGKKPDVILWSESSLPYAYNINRAYYSRRPQGDDFISFMKETGIPLFSGSPYIAEQDGGKKAYNAVVLITPDGELADWYAKMQLVPFAEYIPFTEYECVSRFFDALIGFSSGWEPGTKKTVFHLPLPSDAGSGTRVPFSAPICFEDAFPAVTAALYNEGAKLLVNLTNDSWSKTASAEYQHFTVAYFRAIELRTTLVRSTNGGFTSVILPSGEIHRSLPIFTETYMNAEIPVYPHTATFYARFGDWFAGFAALFAAAASMFALKHSGSQNAALSRRKP